jgi:predicted Fe-Mo cluster-binding NifX family protein
MDIVCVPLAPTGDIDPRWGRAHRVAVAEVVDGVIDSWRETTVAWDIEHDQGTEGAHHARIARFLLDNRVGVVAAQHVGAGMQRMLDSMGIRLVVGMTSNAHEAVAQLR